MPVRRLSLSPRALNTALGFVSIALWSTNVALSRSQAEQLGMFTSASLVCLLAGALGTGRLIVAGRAWQAVRRASPRYLLVCGGMFILNVAGMYLAFGSAANRDQLLGVGLLNYLWPMCTLLFSVPLLRTRASALIVPGTVLSLAGVWLAATQDPSLSWRSLAGGLTAGAMPYLLALLAAVTWGVYSNLSRRWVDEASTGTVPLFMLATGLLLAAARPFFPEQTAWSWRAVLELAFVSIASNVAYVSWERAMQKGDMILVAACSYLIPLFSMLISSVYLGIAVGSRLWVAGALVVAGAWLCKVAIKEREGRETGPALDLREDRVAPSGT